MQMGGLRFSSEGAVQVWQCDVDTEWGLSVQLR